MKRPTGQSKQLVVEGHEDLYSVVGLMKAHIPWPQDPASAPVHIEIGKSAGEILEEEYLRLMLKSREIKELGVMLDADTNSLGRYQRVRQLLGGVFPGMPDQLPEGGLIVNGDEKRFGLWVMPDNRSEGYLETFLRYLVPPASEALWQHATKAVDDASALGASFRAAHIDKARLHTWLSWQDPPGQKAGVALTAKVLDPMCASAGAFVNWFRALYSL